MNDSATVTPVYLGYGKLDRDHAILFEIMGQLGAAIESGSPQNMLDRIMLSLRAYFDAHCDNEEDLMEQSQYPAAASHIVEHQKIRERVDSLAQWVSEGQASASIESLCAMQNWVATHIAHTDLALATHLNQFSGS